MAPTVNSADAICAAMDLAERFATVGLHPSSYDRLKRLARLLGVTVADLVDAAV